MSAEATRRTSPPSTSARPPATPVTRAPPTLDIAAQVWQGYRGHGTETLFRLHSRPVPLLLDGRLAVLRPHRVYLRAGPCPSLRRARARPATLAGVTQPARASSRRHRHRHRGPCDRGDGRDAVGVDPSEGMFDVARAAVRPSSSASPQPKRSTSLHRTAVRRRDRQLRARALRQVETALFDIIRVTRSGGVVGSPPGPTAVTPSPTRGSSSCPRWSPKSSSNLNSTRKRSRTTSVHAPRRGRAGVARRRPSTRPHRTDPVRVEILA